MKKNAQEILNNVNECIEELERAKEYYDYDPYRITLIGYTSKAFRMRSVCEELSIFDWWNDNLSLSQLKQMRTFLKTAISLGFTGYVCFKVGAKYCANGMWAYKEESTTGYSPDGDALYHSFISGENYYEAKLNGVWLHDKYDGKFRFTLAEIKKEMA